MRAARPAGAAGHARPPSAPTAATPVTPRPRRPRRARVWRALVILFAVLIGVLPLVAPVVADAVLDAGDVAGTAALAPPATTRVRRGPMEAVEVLAARVVVDPTAIRGSAAPAMVVPVQAPVDGIVTSVRHRVGDQVRAGEVLAVVSSTDGDAVFPLDEDAAAALAAGGTVDVDRSGTAGPQRCADPFVERDGGDAPGGAPPTSGRLHCRLAGPPGTPTVRPGAAVIGSLASERGVRTLTGRQVARAEAVIAAPVTGSLERAPSSGAAVAAGAEIAAVGVGSVGAVVEAEVAPSALYRVTPTRITVEIEDGPPAFDCPSLGIVALDGGAAPPAAATPRYVVRCRVPEGVAAIPGVDARMSVTTGQRADALKLPRSAVEGVVPSGFVVLVRSVGEVRVPVKIGLVSATQVEILEGVEEGDEVRVFGVADGAAR